MLGGHRDAITAMKKIGIVGGVAWPSTVEYYTQLCRLSEDRHRANDLPGTAPMPEISIESLDLRKALACIGRDHDEVSWSAFDEYHRSALQRLEASGAQLALIASNTAHHRYAAVICGVGIPVINIIEVAAKTCAKIGTSRVLLLGTELTMRSKQFSRGFAEHGIPAAGPDNERARSATIELIADLQLGKLTRAASRVAEIARDSVHKPLRASDIVCLACTELPLAFPEHKLRGEFEIEGIRYLNTSALHVDAAFELATRCLYHPAS